MSVKPIRLFGDPVLRTRAEEVTDFGADLRRLVADLFDTMYDAPGAGLAAPQIGVGLRVFTYWVDDLHGHIVNPVLKLSEQMEDSDEGCLSIPGVSATRHRATHVRVTGSNMHGEPVELTGGGHLARAFQHETDHLDGVLFVDHLDPESKRAAMRVIREAQWAGEPAPTIKASPHATLGRGR